MPPPDKLSPGEPSTRQILAMMTLAGLLILALALISLRYGFPSIFDQGLTNGLFTIAAGVIWLWVRWKARSSTVAAVLNMPSLSPNITVLSMKPSLARCPTCLVCRLKPGRWLILKSRWLGKR